MTVRSDFRQPTRRAAIMILASAVPLAPLTAQGAPLLGTLSDGTAARPDMPSGWRLVYFGYTHCPDVCPTGLQIIAEALEQLGPIRAGITPVFVTVDPDRDTPAVMRDYVSFFHPRMVGITPTPEELRSMAQAWGIKYARADFANGSYAMDHTSTILFLDPRGEIVARLSHLLSPEKVAERIKSVLLERSR